MTWLFLHYLTTYLSNINEYGRLILKVMFKYASAVWHGIAFCTLFFACFSLHSFYFANCVIPEGNGHTAREERTTNWDRMTWVSWDTLHFDETFLMMDTLLMQVWLRCGRDIWSLKWRFPNYCWFYVQIFNT